MSEYLDYTGLQRYHELIDAKKVDKADVSTVAPSSSSTDTTIPTSKSVYETIKTLDGDVTGTAGAGKTLTAFSQTDGKVTATFGNISITKSQISDFPTIPAAAKDGTFSVKTKVGSASAVTAADFTANQSSADDVTFIQGDNVTLTTDATNRTITIAAKDTTYESKAAASGGTAVSLVTTGEKYTWNGKQNALTNPVTRSGSTALTANKIVLGNGNNTVTSSTCEITTTAPNASAADTTVPTSKAVWSAISNGIAANDAMVYSGTIEGGSTENYGALTPAASKGNTYKVTTAGKINGVAVEVGDMLICNTDSTAAATSSNYSTIVANWDFIQANIDGAVTGPTSSTDAHVATFDGATGKKIKDSGFTIGKSVPSNAVFTDTSVTSSANHYTPATGETANVTASGNTTLTRGSSLVITAVTTDSKGHVVGLTTGKMPASDNTDTKVTSAANHYKATGVAAETKSASGATGTAEATVQVITGVTTDAAGHVTGIVSGAATDTNTKVTSAANHYTPATASGSDVTASASGATAAWSIDVVKGITLNTDGKGHITGMSVTSGKIPANPNSDTKVSDANGTGKAFLLGHTTQGTTATAISNANVYMSGGKLYSNGKEVAIAENIPSLTPISYGSGSTLDNTKQIDSLFV